MFAQFTESSDRENASALKALGFTDFTSSASQAAVGAAQKSYCRQVGLYLNSMKNPKDLYIWLHLHLALAHRPADATPLPSQMVRAGRQIHCPRRSMGAVIGQNLNSSIAIRIYSGSPKIPSVRVFTGPQIIGILAWMLTARKSHWQRSWQQG